MHARKRLHRTALLGALLAIASVAGCEENGAGSDALATLTHVAKKAMKQPKRVDKSPYGQKADDYVLTFSEEFDSFDRNRWNDHVWYETPNPTKNYDVEYGLLKIWPQRDASGKFFNRTIDTDGKFEQTYGYFEIEAKLSRGKGTWPAFWLFAHPDKRRPEIDIMEAYPGGVDPWGFVDDSGVARPQAFAVTVWRDEGMSVGARQFDTGVDLSTKFHKYAVKWEPHGQTFYFDGKKVLEVAERMSDPMYIVVDLWFGSASGEPDETTPEGKANSFEVNYIRAWQFRHRVTRD